MASCTDDDELPRSAERAPGQPEYCISEGWIRVTIGKAVDRRGRPLTIQRKGAVEPFFKE
ncbi:MAG: DUF3297 family protein [Proteobacteria bacterium]|nr:DUF3297 family protein [Pseudomonadota bacterium]